MSCCCYTDNGRVGAYDLSITITDCISRQDKGSSSNTRTKKSEAIINIKNTADLKTKNRMRPGFLKEFWPFYM